MSTPATYSARWTDEHGTTYETAPLSSIGAALDQAWILTDHDNPMPADGTFTVLDASRDSVVLVVNVETDR